MSLSTFSYVVVLAPGVLIAMASADAVVTPSANSKKTLPIGALQLSVALMAKHTHLLASWNCLHASKNNFWLATAVCGTDGKTYTPACQLDLFACK